MRAAKGADYSSISKVLVDNGITRTRHYYGYTADTTGSGNKDIFTQQSLAESMPDSGYCNL
jgi:hypothetical protein